MPNEDWEREKRSGRIRSPVLQRFFFFAHHKVTQFTRAKTASSDSQRKKATRITDQCSEYWWDRGVRSRNVMVLCASKNCNHLPVPHAQLRGLIACLQHHLQCSCMALDQTVWNSAIWERVMRSLILPLCLRATFKWGLPTWTLQHYIIGKPAYGRLEFLARATVKPSSS